MTPERPVPITLVLRWAGEFELVKLMRTDLLMAEADDDFEWVVTDENAAMGLCCTRGPTGEPKGFLHSHRSTYLHALGLCQPGFMGATGRDMIMPVLQFHVTSTRATAACATSSSPNGCGADVCPAPAARCQRDGPPGFQGRHVLTQADVPIWIARMCALKSAVQYMRSRIKVNIADAKARLSEYIKRVEAGETILVARRNEPIAEIRPISRSERTPRPMGLCAGEFQVPSDFDEPLPEDVLKDFED